LTLTDPGAVSAQYASETNLEARRSIYANAEGPDPRDVTFAAIREVAPARVLEVGGGPGELAARILTELEAELVMLDTSPRMVELARQKGVDARVGDVQHLPFADGEFDCVVAAWMLFHVPDLDRALREIVRVLRGGGRFVATTNAERHLRELRNLAGVAPWTLVFSRENGAEILGRHFSRVERRDADGWVTVEDEQTVRAYISSLGRDPMDPAPFDLPLRARRASSVFVAAKA
jgi:SAM-dependent methyltransferase